MYVSTDAVILDDAVTACTAKGAEIGKFADSTQEADAFKLMTADTWIGLNDEAADTAAVAVTQTDNGFVWADGSTPTYYNWYGTGNPMSPSNAKKTCTKMQFDQGGKWNDVGCGKTMNYLCRMDAVDSCATTTTFVSTTPAGSAAGSSR
jgi:hypothetical protein